MEKLNLRNYTLEELETLILSLDEPKYRAEQIFHWITCREATDFDQMTNLPKGLRTKLSTHFSLELPEVIEKISDTEGTTKFALRLRDGEIIETVVIPERDHYTLCVSTQVGCAMGCKFCLTAKGGFKRNLEVYEILAQVVIGRLYLKEKGSVLPLRNIVFMGMGEPLANYENLIKVLKILAHPLGFNFSKKRLTISTVGLVKEIRKLAIDFPTALAVSLHAPNDELRKNLIPVAKKYLLKELLEVIKTFPRVKNGRTTIEYILLKDVNDSLQHAKELVKLFKGLPIKINLIPYNPHPELPFERPDEKQVERFQRFLLDHAILTTVRKSKGLEISAACGQLKRRLSTNAIYLQ
ncbi:23S rRNA (adenine(2503)-C(2))-methyltransferase RlmN [Thermodesulfobacterium sp. TA1]|uniref:23S rRNA (adenine(2503)-C(2))-methyltransferase RlmN n=1 Tax=Thermodesulfobacterium sp. TA1 TaxID=2234087 RepID=UPI001232D370|nr:23S rRNA (adenine(2503)-C(2))-methyltransferase RlmN [Thermodesulfobacterium sp. TA1]QER41554.1 23S rRNA (adenine(2503)-C(2))-methyltransferase RlmN [Thermodesulfobacterium sp. TA1]